MFFKMFNIFKLLRPISPNSCLIRQVQPEKLIEALIYEDEEFYGKKAPRSIEFYEKLIDTPQWKKFCEGIMPNDELWFFRYPDKYWKKLKGRQGYVILRNGKIVDKIITIMN